MCLILQYFANYHVHMPRNVMFRFVSRSLSRRISPSSTLTSKQSVQHTLAECIMSRDTAFASCMMAANALDVHGNASRMARHAVAVAKVVSPRYRFNLVCPLRVLITFSDFQGCFGCP
jgi:alkylation response protein AidB-like acyl-CoA dehydrogenase